MKPLIWIFVLFVCLKFNLNGQVLDGGLPYMNNFPPVEYKAASQNWCIIHHPQGFLYIGNGEGLLQFDGNNWQLIHTQNRSQVRSFDVASDGKIYAGAQAEFGYFYPDSSGRLAYKSLIKKVPDKYHDFTDIWSTHILSDKIIFQSSKYVFIYKNDTIKTIVGKEQFHKGFKVENKYFIRQKGVGLLLLQNDSLHLLPNGELFKKDQINAIFKRNDTLMLVSREAGFYSFDGKMPKNIFKKQTTKIDEELRNHRLFSFTKLGDKYYAFGTLENGVIVTDRNFNRLLQLDAEKGLIDNQILNLASDNFGNLWVATGNGISHIQINSPFRLFDKRMDFNEVAYISTVYDGNLLIGSSNGLWKKDENNKFVKIDKTEDQFWSFFRNNNKLTCCFRHGIFDFDGKEFKEILLQDNIWKMVPLRNSEYYLAGTYFNGLYLMSHQNNKWKRKAIVKNYKRSTRFFFEDENENIWISDANQGIIRLTLNSEKDSVISQKTYKKENGLPESAKNYIFKIKNRKEELVYATSKGIYYYDATKDSFLVHQLFSEKIPAKETDLFAQDEYNRIWFQQYAENGYLKGYISLNNGSVKNAHYTPFYKFHEIYAENISPIDSSNVLFNTSLGVIHYNALNDIDYDRNYPCHIRKVYAKDSIYYKGNPKSDIHTSQFVLDLPYDLNSLTFDFSSTFFEDYDKLQYSFQLDGFDNDWSAWTTKTSKEYTNLFEGTYNFKVKAKNIYKKESEIATFTIRINPPISRTIAAYVLYLILAILIIWIIVRLNTRRLKLEKLRLERIVEERTAEITEQKKEILDKNSELEQQKEEIKAQAEYLQEANINLNKQKNEIELQKGNIEKAYDNIKMLSEIGREITQNLTINSIASVVYWNVNQLMNASVFAIGILDENNHSLQFSGAIEENRILQDFYYSLNDENRLAIICLKRNTDIFLNNYEAEYSSYFPVMPKTLVGERPSSIIYVPLKAKNKIIGVLTVQSFEKNAYTEYHLNILKNLALYTAVAIENAESFDRIERNKKLIEQKNNAITSSINYAKRIQNALLPNTELRNMFLPQSFVLYKPRDIVSGDFYWTRIVRNKLMFAVADCTGHGVPGAFMSILGIAFLNEIVNKPDNTNAASILNKLKTQVIEALGQTGKMKETKDGMDIALCVIDLESMKMDYSGAYNPIYLFRNNQLTEFKGDKMPIGIHVREKENFENHNIQLKPNDMIYLFSDGFVDQVGGKKGRKYLHRNLKILLSQINQKSVQEQRKILELELENWMNPPQFDGKRYNQVDDIVIMGVRV